MDVVPFLKAPLRLLSIVIHTSGENPKSPNGAMAALLRRALIEDTILKQTTGGSLEGVRRSLSVKACSLGFTLHADFWEFLVVPQLQCGNNWLDSWCWPVTGGVYDDGGVALKVQWVR
jgi:hypothetical protein